MHVKITNGIPSGYSIAKLRRDNPNVSFPDIIPPERLADWNVYECDILDKPDFDPETQHLTEGQYQMVDGRWKRGWTINERTSDEILARKESKRNGSSMTRFEFAVAASEAGFITHLEAAQWAAGNAIPASVQAVIDALPEDLRGKATIEVLSRPTIRRNGTFMAALAAAYNTDDAGLDALFGI